MQKKAEPEVVTSSIRVSKEEPEQEYSEEEYEEEEEEEVQVEEKVTKRESISSASDSHSDIEDDKCGRSVSGSESEGVFMKE